jgi:homoserine dehydrogenase
MNINMILDPNSPLAQQTARDVRALITAQRSQDKEISQQILIEMFQAKDMQQVVETGVNAIVILTGMVSVLAEYAAGKTDLTAEELFAAMFRIAEKEDFTF